MGSDPPPTPKNPTSQLDIIVIMILITNFKVFRNTRAKATPHYNLLLCRRDSVQNILVTVFEHTTFINRNLVTGI